MKKVVEEVVSRFADRLRGSPRVDVERYVEKLQSRGLGPDGRQVPDPVPVAPPIGYRKQPSMFDIQRQMIRDHLEAYARSQELETLEDFEDFEVGDEPHELLSGYENDGDPPLEELLEAGRQAIAERERVKSGGVGGSPPTQGQGAVAPSQAPQEPVASSTTLPPNQV